ncbi:DUF6838 family protein [Caldifermentibacillus hisashii]|uniref:DUF6838 family protein n=1 Tax=Caldifermentibacillus hisashii TaxID=996558 RepID=A0ABU9JVP0_9BACI
MITYRDIRKAINAKLKNEFNIEINSNDVKEGFKRPSFFVTFDNLVKSSDQSQFDRSLTIRIYYFPTDRYDYSLELLDIQEQLENLFDLKFNVLDRKFNIFESSSLITDGVLEFSFDIQFSDAKDVPVDDNVVEIPVDEDGYPSEIGKPVEVIGDENGNPVLDGNEKPIPIELMETLDIKKG